MAFFDRVLKEYLLTKAQAIEVGGDCLDEGGVAVDDARNGVSGGSYGGFGEVGGFGGDGANTYSSSNMTISNAYVVNPGYGKTGGNAGSTYGTTDSYDISIGSGGAGSGAAGMPSRLASKPEAPAARLSRVPANDQVCSSWTGLLSSFPPPGM